MFTLDVKVIYVTSLQAKLHHSGWERKECHGPLLPRTLLSFPSPFHRCLDIPANTGDVNASR